MAKWKLSRQEFGNEEFELAEGEITIGRGLNNLIKLSSIVISRNHCSIYVKADEVSITDLKSSNGVYVGKKKIAPNSPYKLTNNDIVGFGWAIEAPLGNIKNDEKHVYKLIKIGNYPEPHLKRKLSQETLNREIEIENPEDIEDTNKKESVNSNAKKIKLESILIDLTEEENEDLEYEVFKDKQDYIMIDDEDIILSDSDLESEHLFERLSQNSPGRPLVKIEIKTEKSKTHKENNSYSQIEDDELIDLDEICALNEVNGQEIYKSSHILPSSEHSDNKVCHNTTIASKAIDKGLIMIANDNGSESVKFFKNFEKNEPTTTNSLLNNTNKLSKNIQILEPVLKPSKNKSLNINFKNELNISKNNKRLTRKQSTSSNKTTLTNSQKEVRRNKLKEISLREKEKKSKSELKTKTAEHEINKNIVNENTSQKLEPLNTSNQQHAQNDSQSKNFPRPRRTIKIIEPICQIPTKSRIAHVKKPLIEKNKSNVNIPSKNIQKKVRFSDAPAEVLEFAIESDKVMKSIKLIKKENRQFLIDRPKRYNVSQKKIALMKILRWNTRWLEEQKKFVEPPPIVKKENLLRLFLSFRDHQQYVRQVGTLLLLEIWEYITQGHKDNKRSDLHFEIESLPPKPPPERYYELFTICVKLSISTSDLKHLPRDGDIIVIKPGSEHSDKWRFCFVYNVTHLSSSAKQKTYSLSFYVKYSDYIEGINIGEIILGRNIANINQELLLFEAMGNLTRSPLRETILRPQPCQYPIIEQNDKINMKSKWIANLNASQLRAVRESVSAALDTSPALRMVQGPPGTGKSSVICAMVMSYFYDGSTGRKQSNRGKILICATSNAAVDELVIRLLNMREKLPLEERFRMVRVGRLEAMHERAKDISSQTLAKREQSRGRKGDDPALWEEIALCEASMNRWKTEQTKDPARAAYCENRASYYAQQIELLRGGEVSKRQLVAEERRLVGSADVIATTLSSAVGHKMQRLTGIELCIVDEAGQAIEPEALLPLTLGVTKLTLVGDPQQLPGFICSQRAKKYGLDKSLFSRISSCSEEWERPPVVLLDQQYRMHPAIADYPNRAFYAGKVHSVPPAPVHLCIRPYCILAIPASGREAACCEARGAASVAHALALAARAHKPPLSVAVITPYVAHRDLIKTYLGDLATDESRRPVEVNTVDGFQGQERDVVVVSVGRRRGVGFLADAGRMNVLLTRARHVLVVCLDPHAVEEHGQWKTLLEDAKAKKVFMTLPQKMCQPSSRQISPDEVINFLKN